MQPQNEELDIIDRLVEVEYGYEFGEWDNQRGQLHQPAEVERNLRGNLEFWIHIGTPKFILSVIANAYCLPFQCTPVCISLNNNKSALKFKDFVEEAIEELLLTNRVEEKLNPPYVVNPLSFSVQANGKKRLILDLRHVNKYYFDKKKSEIRRLESRVGFLPKGLLYGFV